MMETYDISKKFKTLEEFEQFSLEWALICEKLNNNEENRKQVKRWQKVNDRRK